MNKRALVTTLALAAVLPSSAAGGQYELHSCRLPGGEPIPAVGWLGQYGGGTWLQSDDTCVAGGALTAGLMGVPSYAHPQGAYSRWRLGAPAGTTIRRLRGHFAFRTAVGQDYGSPVVEAEADEGQGRFGIGPGASRGSPAAWNAPANEHDTGTITPTRGLRVGVLCAGGHATCPYEGGETARADIYRAQATLEDLTDPQVSRTAGRLLEVGPHRGVEHLHLEASDSGSGVYRLIVELDGVEAVRQVIDSNAGQCADAWSGGSEYDFTSPVPCKLEVDGGETLDTRLLPDGEHRLRLLVEDAAGNRRVAAGPIESWEVRNAAEPAPAGSPPPAAPMRNGAPATARARIALFFLTARFTRRCVRRLNAGGRAHTRCRRVRRGREVRRRAAVSVPYPRGVRLAGRLVTRDGRPIAGARLGVVRRRSGSRRPTRRFARTRPDGRFRVRLGSAPSERIRVVYRPTASSRRPVRSRTLTRRSPAAVRIRVSRRSLRAGERVVLHGRVLGGRRPRHGVAVVAEVRLRAGWTVFAERRVRRRARFRASGRFARPGRYALRVRVVRTRGYPFEGSRSRAIGVRVR